jgi:hypothetical protein
MKATIIIGLFVLLVIVVGAFQACSTTRTDGKKLDGIAASSKFIDSVEVAPYGLFNGEVKQTNIQYSVCPASVILSIIFSETIIAPVYFLGWELYQPIGKIK